jgi:hypothetical protein
VLEENKSPFLHETLIEEKSVELESSPEEVWEEDDTFEDLEETESFDDLEEAEEDLTGMEEDDDSDEGYF